MLRGGGAVTRGTGEQDIVDVELDEYVVVSGRWDGVRGPLVGELSSHIGAELFVVENSGPAGGVEGVFVVLCREAVQRA
ncbi:MAG: hypothetical protein H0U21_10215 [Acidimicrobiia bacterium]|nr:hypothetical protein [Acidimicrobiia bacterium]